ncbi:MAG: 4-hydroxy-3-methylbut-2-enyl diphosphate reductase [Bacteroidetes bacterium]|nr:4-hydroxy-3-methylbut-2-enyl diphosphate reductase [Bacteroidota bacterium]
MNVRIDPTAGFCWGVVRTIDIAEEELRNGNALVSLGDIIHNPKEIERLDALGMHTIDHAKMEELPDGTRVLIRAHGEPASTYRRANELGIQLIDATCPIVTKLQERIRKYYLDGWQVVIFGKKDHAEVIGLRGVCNDDCIVIKTLDEAREAVDLSRPTVLFSQTTMDKATFHDIREFLRSRVGEFHEGSMEEIATSFHAKDTICGQVSGRDKKLRAFAEENDVMVFVAGRKSSNGKVLYHICLEANPRTHFIEDVNEIDPSWFENTANVGISGATSTPQWLMNEVKIHIEQMAVLEGDDRAAATNKQQQVPTNP